MNVSMVLRKSLCTFRMGTWLASAAKKTMVFPSLSSRSSFAPLSRSTLKALTWPLAAAVIRGVYELLSAAVISAPLGK